MRSDMTIAEALETAMEFELASLRFYRSLAPKVREEVRPLVRELAEEERRHYRLLVELARDAAFAEHLRTSIERPSTSDELASFISLPALPNDPIDDDILEYAEAREQIAREHYGYLAEITPSGPLRDLFALLRDEESKHASGIGARWSKMFSIL